MVFAAGRNLYAAPLIRLACGEPPSPEGEGFGAVELGGGRGKPTWAAGACPRPTKGTSILTKLLTDNEPGGPQRWWSTARVADLHCQRPLAARRPCLSLWERWHGASRDGEGFFVYHHVTNRVTPSGGGLPPG